MTAKQTPGLLAPDGSTYVVLTDGAGTLAPAGGSGATMLIGDGTTSPVAVKPASTAPVATDKALVTTLSPNSPGIVALGQVAKAASVPVTMASDQGAIGSLTTQLPAGATFVTASTTGTTGATTATLAGVSAKTTYLLGFSIRATATAAAVGNATVTGTISGTLNFTQFSQAASTGMVPLEPNIGSVAIPASATNTAIAVVSAAPGTGGVVSVTAWGYQL